jgi:putative alpha-1,2-mannosidase
MAWNSLWDSFRSQIPFLTILDPVAVAQMVRSLIDTYVHQGWLPDCHMSLCKGYTQVECRHRCRLDGSTDMDPGRLQRG